MSTQPIWIAHWIYETNVQIKVQQNYDDADTKLKQKKKHATVEKEWLVFQCKTAE